jgi:hypothetical protein
MFKLSFALLTACALLLVVASLAPPASMPFENYYLTEN